MRTLNLQDLKSSRSGAVGSEAREETVAVLKLPNGGGLSEDNLGGILEIEASWE